MGLSTDKQKGSVASLTFPFSSSQPALGCPFITIDSCSFCRLRGQAGGETSWRAAHSEQMLHNNNTAWVQRHVHLMPGHSDGDTCKMNPSLLAKIVVSNWELCLSDYICLWTFVCVCLCESFCICVWELFWVCASPCCSPNVTKDRAIDVV